MSLLSSSPWSFAWACRQPAVEGVSNRGTGEQQQHWDQSELGECPQFSGQSGRRVVKRGEKREGGRSGRWCGDLCVLRVVFTVSFQKNVRY